MFNTILKRSFLVAVFLFVGSVLVAQTQGADPDALTKEGDLLFVAGQYKAASAKYKAAVDVDNLTTAAQAGLIRSELAMDDLDKAVEAGNAALKATQLSAPIHSAMGEVYFRLADMVNAEKEFQTAIKVDRSYGRAYLGLSSLYQAYSFNRKAYDFLTVAETLSPSDPDIHSAWLYSLPRKAKIAELEKQGDLNEDAKRYLSRLKIAESTGATCKLSNKVDKTQFQFSPLMYNAKVLRAWGLKVGVNEKFATLLFDTGAGGIVISRKIADQAGVTRLWDTKHWGVGDEGPVSGYAALAKKIRVGTLEFENCIVEVVDRKDVAEEDGLIGGNVFSNFLVDINYPTETLTLSPLPKDPNEPASPEVTLNSDATPGVAEHSSADSVDPKVRRLLYHDRYVSPEMQNWVKVFRSGYHLLVPTFVNHVGPRYFLLDTGAGRNTLALNFAREISKVSVDHFNRLKGVSGEVKQVMSTSKAEVQFGTFKTRDFDVQTIDMSSFSRSDGFENSGVLGFEILRMLELKIDYRDGLVDFIYDRDKNLIPNLNNRKNVFDFK